jgi:hypothetical protein
MGAGEPHVVTQEVDERQPWLDLRADGLSVDDDLDGMLFESHCETCSRACVTSAPTTCLR